MNFRQLNIHSIVNYMYLTWKAKLCDFQKIHGKVHDCLYMLFIVLIRYYVYIYIFLSAFLHCLSCVRFRSRFLSHLPSQFVLLVVFSCLNAAQQSLPNPTVHKTWPRWAKQHCRSRWSPYFDPLADHGIDIPMTKPFAIYAAATFLARLLHISIWFTTFNVIETRTKYTNFKIAYNISARDDTCAREDKTCKELQSIYWAISLKHVLSTVRQDRLEAISEHFIDHEFGIKWLSPRNLLSKATSLSSLQ